MFTGGQIVITAVAGGAASVATALLYRRPATHGLRSALALGVVVALSIVLWRGAGNTSALNQDPLPFVSPNDVLCPVVTYVFLGLFGAVSEAGREARWPSLRLLLTIVSLIANVLTI